MASKCKCYCFCSLDIYAHIRGICDMINMKLKHCRLFELFVVALGFWNRACFRAFGTWAKKSAKKTYACVNVCCSFSNEKLHLPIQSQAGVYRRVRVLISYSTNPAQFFFATLRQFVNDLNNLWDGSIINFRYARKHFGSLLKCVCVRLNAGKHILTVCKWIW